MLYRGSCHCGAVTFAAEGAIETGLACNCSICRRRGTLLWFAPSTAFQLTSGDDALRTYTFNKHVIRHHFCGTCGIATHGEGAMPDGTPMTAVNVRCIEAVEIESLQIDHYDGRSK